MSLAQQGLDRSSGYPEFCADVLWARHLIGNLRTFARKTSTIQIFFILWLQPDNELPMSEMQKNWGVTDFVFELKRVKNYPILTNRPSQLDIASVLVS